MAGPSGRKPPNAAGIESRQGAVYAKGAVSKRSGKKRRQAADEGELERDTDVEKRIAEVVGKHRAALNAELREISPNIVVELAGVPSTRITDPGRFFSDWPDSFNNDGGWYKTWGKGGDIAALPPREELRQRILAARLRGDLER